MRSYLKITVLYTLVLLLLFGVSNLLYAKLDYGSNGANYYKVEINRALASTGRDPSLVQKLPDLAGYSTLLSVEQLPESASSSELSHFYRSSTDSYTFVEQNGLIYRFTYKDVRPDFWVRVLINSVLFLIGLLGYVLLFTIYLRIIRPFDQIRKLPEELSRGVLANELPQQKSKLFRHFIWSLNLLKEHLEEQKEKELKLQKEKQTMVLSISHDIKTPLSAIKLYSKALSEHLYTDEEKKEEAAKKINIKADEISQSINALIKTSTEDFLDFTVENGEFYLSSFVEKISAYYEHRMEATHTEFHIGAYDNCLIQGDLSRMCEVSDNFLENAIKYGDGKKVEITFTYEENCVLMTVMNTGCRLLSDEVPHIFDCFKRGSNSDSCTGSGLGLYIARKLCSNMGGEVFAKVENSCFYVTAVMKKIN